MTVFNWINLYKLRLKDSLTEIKIEFIKFNRDLTVPKIKYREYNKNLKVFKIKFNNNLKSLPTIIRDLLIIKDDFKVIDFYRDLIVFKIKL